MNQINSAATDVPQFLSDLDAGQFERKLAVAISQVALACTLNADGKSGEVSIRLVFKPISGTSQVTCEHKLEFTRPTQDGSAGEKESRSTVMHVGKNGAVSLASPGLFGKQGEVA